MRFYVLSILLFHPPISSISGGNVHRKDVLGCFRGLVCQPRGKTQCTPLSGFTVYLCHNVGTPGTPSSPSGDNADWMLSTPAILISKLDTDAIFNHSSCPMSSHCRILRPSTSSTLAIVVGCPGAPLVGILPLPLPRQGCFDCRAGALISNGGAVELGSSHRSGGYAFFGAYPAWPPVNIARW